MTTENTKVCSVDGCKKLYRAKGYCDIHYKKWRQGELDKKSRYKTCVQEKCRKARYQQSSLCEDHFKAKFGKKEEAAPAA